MRGHIRVHEIQEIPKDQVCTECNRTFTTKPLLKRHMENVHKVGV